MSASIVGNKTLLLDRNQISSPHSACTCDISHRCITVQARQLILSFPLRLRLPIQNGFSVSWFGFIPRQIPVYRTMNFPTWTNRFQFPRLSARSEHDGRYTWSRHWPSGEPRLITKDWRTSWEEHRSACPSSPGRHPMPSVRSSWISFYHSLLL